MDYLISKDYLQNKRAELTEVLNDLGEDVATNPCILFMDELERDSIPVFSPAETQNDLFANSGCAPASAVILLAIVFTFILLAC